MPLDLRLAPGLVDVRRDRLTVLFSGDLRHQRVFGRHDHECRAENGIRTCREDLQGLAGVKGKTQPGTLGTTDPVTLHHLDAFRPIDAVESVQQLLGILRDSEVPLLQVPLVDLCPTTLADAAFEHLLVGQYRLVVWTPPHRTGYPVCQASLQHLQEDPLVPVVIVRRAGCDFARPVDHRPHQIVLAAHLRDVLEGPGRGVDVVPDCRVLSREAERIKAHREQHIMSTHALQAGKGVRNGKGVPVPDVEDARRVRIHRQREPLRLWSLVIDGVQPGLLPGRAPLRFDHGRIIGMAVVKRWCG